MGLPYMGPPFGFPNEGPKPSGQIRTISVIIVLGFLWIEKHTVR